ncbi:hypothetical protein CORC01_00771 [Colletotrichum orchidophilum]|uniref:Uncharacterized protein n=1 Tax=Colletotrichum orchidophilum TaxID=1209926 RepID=A0A1G4BR43_9PEZI|nr:uncharacterized protein CORC01_00771 [Colletotrichum orchidophilum]OHF03909.1 hypothetical protein CORC01_00771 [Colletotrichum orchidophilum]
MKFSLIIVALSNIFASAIAAPVAKSVPAKDNSGGRLVLDGAQCSPVQGRLVCDDGFGNTFFADDPFSS